MQRRFWKSIIILMVIAFTGCSTLESIFGGLGGSDSGTTSTRATTSGGNSSSSPARAARTYKLPSSYETAYSYRTDTAYQAMKSIPKNIDSLRATNPDEYVTQVVAIINKNAKNTFEKVKMANDVVALLVKYDAANFWANTVPDQSYRSVLKNRLAVCEGYSNTFKKFCDVLGVPCEIVHGYGRGVGTSPIADDHPNNSNHAWNIVTIDGEDYLVDCTWNSGFMDGRVAKQEYTTDWLFLKPEHFLYTHYPENSKQQLLATPLSAAQFSSLPFFKPKYFEIASNVSMELKKINNVENNLSFNFNAKDGYRLSFTLNDVNSGREIPNSTFVQSDGTKETAYFSFPAAGQYAVSVFWWKTGATRGEGCGEFVAAASSASTVQFPLTYSSTAKNLRIISPIEMPLKKGQQYTFKFGVDNKKVMAIIYGKTFVQMVKGADGIFSADLTIPNNISDLTIGVADSERGRYESILKYTVK